MEDDFLAIMEGVDLVEPEGVVNVTALSDLELVDLYANVRKNLLTSGQMMSDTKWNPGSTDEGRSLHSLRAALLAEMAKRDLR
jgi:hypothetical protein